MLNARGSFLTLLPRVANSCAGLAGRVWAIFSYLALGDSGAGSLHVGWSVHCWEQLGKLLYDAHASDKVLTLQKSIYSFLLLIFHNILGLHGVVLQVLCLRKEAPELQQS